MPRMLGLHIDHRSGIDVQAELKSKNEGARMGPTIMSPVGGPQHFPLQRSVMSRPELPNRTVTVPLPKISVQTQSPAGGGAKQSPRTSRAQTLSPITNKSPVSSGHRRMTSSGADLRGPLSSQFRNRNHPRRHSGIVSKTSVPPMQAMRPSTRDGSSDTGGTSGAHSNYYASPFQTHIEQLGKLSPLRPLRLGRIGCQPSKSNMTFQSKNMMHTRTCWTNRRRLSNRPGQGRIRSHFTPSLPNRVSNTRSAYSETLRFNQCTRCAPR